MRTFTAIALLCTAAVNAVRLSQDEASSGYDVQTTQLKMPVFEQTKAEYLSHMTHGQWNQLSDEESFQLYQKEVYAANKYYKEFSDMEGLVDKEERSLEKAQATLDAVDNEQREIEHQANKFKDPKKHFEAFQDREDEIFERELKKMDEAQKEAKEKEAEREKEAAREDAALQNEAGQIAAEEANRKAAEKEMADEITQAEDALKKVEKEAPKAIKSASHNATAPIDIEKEIEQFAEKQAAKSHDAKKAAEHEAKQVEASTEEASSAEKIAKKY